MAHTHMYMYIMYTSIICISINIYIYKMLYIIAYSIAQTYVPEDLFFHEISYGTIISRPTLET